MKPLIIIAIILSTTFLLYAKNDDCLNVLHNVNNHLYPFLRNVESLKYQVHCNAIDNLSNELMDYDQSLIDKCNIDNIKVFVEYNLKTGFDVVYNNVKITGNKAFDDSVQRVIKTCVLPIRKAVYCFQIFVQTDSLSKDIKHAKIDTIQDSYELSYADYGLRAYVYISVKSNYSIKNYKIVSDSNNYVEIIPGFIQRDQYFLPNDIDMAYYDYFYCKYLFGYDFNDTTFPSSIVLIWEKKESKFEAILHFAKVNIKLKNIKHR